MGKIVIACYKPLTGKEEELKKLMKTHVPILRTQGLATERESIIMEAGDGTIVEVFEWASDEAIEKAHSNPEVLKMWEAYEKVCEYVPVGSLKQSNELFSGFDPLN